MSRRYFVAAAVAVFGLVPFHVFAASLYFAPAATAAAVGQTFNVAVDVSSVGQAMNAASGDISFPTDKLRVLSVSNADSAMSLWVQNPSFSNAVGAGDINFAGVVLNPGFTGTGGNVVTIKFQAVGAGNVTLSFSTGSVLANDGNGTDILTSMGTASITITPAAPAPAAPAPAPVAVSSPPAPFVISEETMDPTDPQPIFTWSTTAASGIAKYLVKIGDGDWFDASTIEMSSTPDTYQLPLQAPEGNVLLAVDAYDDAGDVTESTTTFSIAPLLAPTISNYSKQIAEGQNLMVTGSSTLNTTVKVYLERSGDVLTFLVPVGVDGSWSLSQSVTAAAGTWSLKAQAIDARGAISSFTPDYSITIGGWLGEALQFLLTWGFVILLSLLLLALIIALILYLIHRLRHLHLSLGRDLIRERKELRDDLKRIETELEADESSSRIDLSAAGLKKKQEHVHREIKHLEEDLKRDIKENG